LLAGVLNGLSLVLNYPSVPSSPSLWIRYSVWPELSELPIVEVEIVFTTAAVYNKFFSSKDKKKEF